MRETRSSGSVEGVVSNHDPYPDSLTNLLGPLLHLCTNPTQYCGREHLSLIGISRRFRLCDLGS